MSHKQKTEVVLQEHASSCPLGSLQIFGSQTSAGEEFLMYFRKRESAHLDFMRVNLIPSCSNLLQFIPSTTE